MEIGSIFEIDINKLFNNNDISLQRLPFEKELKKHNQYFNSGRAAIEALMLDLKPHKRTVWLPTYCCSSVYDAVSRAGLNIKQYDIKLDLSPSIEELPEKISPMEDVFYFVHYFGKRLGKQQLAVINKLREMDVVLVEDLSLSLLSNEEQGVGFGDYILGSLRKWFSIPDGAFLMSYAHEVPHPLHQASNDYTMYYFTAQLMKKNYLESNNLDKNKYLQLSNEGMNTLFSDYTIRKMSEVSQRLYAAEDISTIIKERTDNFDYLYSELSKIELVQIPIDRQENMVPLGMYILTERRDALFQYLIKSGVYCNIHWRYDPEIATSPNSRYLSEHCITIPCDQRYGKKEMDYIISHVKYFLISKIYNK